MASQQAGKEILRIFNFENTEIFSKFHLFHQIMRNFCEGEILNEYEGEAVKRLNAENAEKTIM